MVIDNNILGNIKNTMVQVTSAEPSSTVGKLVHY